MTNPAWGTKRICPSCEGKYYDFDRSPIVCPKCGVEFDPATATRLRSDPHYRPAAGRPKSVFGKAGIADDGGDASRPFSDEPAETEEIDEEEEAEPGDSVEDVSELEDDEDDLAEVAEIEEES
jgi:uncharacterized protein (TIGR02300 family)